VSNLQGRQLAVPVIDFQLMEVVALAEKVLAAVSEQEQIV